MAAIKSYTDIEQSKKLAEVLSLESSDMCWQYQKDRWVGEPDYEEFPQFEHATDKRDIPCWSLAALLNILPADKIITMGIILENDKKIFSVGYMDKDKMYQSEKENMVDACYEIIIKLHELNLL